MSSNTTTRRLVGGLTMAALCVAMAACSDPKSATNTAPTASASVTSSSGTTAPGASPVARASAGATTPRPAASGAATTPVGGLIGPAGMAAWDALSPAQRDTLKGVPILYLHQSVGQDLEDGSEANGFKFEYFGPGQTTVANGPNGGIFTDVGNVPNAEPFKKMDLVRQVVTSLGGKARVVSFSFGYADVRDEDLAAVQTAYQRLVSDIQSTGVRFVHVTPPLVYSTEENGPKMKMRTWMLATFKSDVIFDLQDIESLANGARCEAGGVWRICQENRSTPTCPSKGQGIDEDGAGHLCEQKAGEFSKAMLYAFYQAAQ